MLPREHYRRNDRVRAVIFDVREEVRGPQIFLTRAQPTFLAKLFAQEVPEIYDGIIEIKAAARDPGSRSKIAVIRRIPGIAPVRPWFALRHSRSQARSSALAGKEL